MHLTALNGWCVCPEPGQVSRLRISKLTSTTAQMMWNRLPCREHSGIAVGYMYELRRHLQTSQLPVNLMFGIINGTSLDLNSLVPFTNYTFSIHFANDKYQGRRSSQDFTTFEDCEYLMSSQKFAGKVVVTLLHFFAQVCCMIYCISENFG